MDRALLFRRRKIEQAVLTWAQSQGFTVTMRFPNRLLVQVQARVAVIEKALQINLNNYQIGNKSYFSTIAALRFPARWAESFSTFSD